MSSKVVRVVVAVVAGLGLNASSAMADVSLSGPSAVSEGATGAAVTFTVTRGAVGLGATVPVTVAVAPGSIATCPGDVSAPCSQTVQLAAGVLVPTTATVSFPVVNDTADEDDEALTARITDAGGQTVGTAEATGTITDDDDPPAVTVGAASAAEGTGEAATALGIPVKLSAASGKAVEVSYALTGGTADASDVGLTTGKITIPAGQTQATIPAAVVADVVDEDDETFTVTLSAPVNAALGAAATQSAVATITDDDTASASLTEARVPEAAKAATFAVMLSTPSAKPVSVVFATQDGTATAPADYTATSTTVAFAPGETARSVTVPVVDDTVAEPDEFFLGSLRDPVNTVLGTQLVGAIIVNDDRAATGSGTGTGGGTGSGATTGKDGEAPDAKLSAFRFRKPSSVTVKLSCPAGETTCKTTVTAFTSQVPRSKVTLLRKERKIGQQVVSVAGGSTKTVTIKVSAKLAKAIKQAKGAKATAFAVTRDAAGNIATTQLRGTLKP